MPGQGDDGANFGSLLSQMLIKRCRFARATENEDGHVGIFA
jgi:hypothetical protein